MVEHITINCFDIVANEPALFFGKGEVFVQNKIG